MTQKICTNCESENSIKSNYCKKCGFELPRIEMEIPSIQTTEPTDKKKKIKSIIIGFIAFAVSYVAVQQFFFNKPSFDKQMMEVASLINESCPIMVDAETRLDNAVALPDNVFQYNYTLVNLEEENVNTNEMRKFLEPTVVNSVKTTPQMEVQREHKTTINYHYKDKNGVFLLLISVTPDKYE